MQRGFSINFDDDHCVIFDKKKKFKVARIKMIQNKTFPLTMPLEGNIALKVLKNNDSFLWNQRYGHLNFNSLKLLKEKNMVVGLPSISKISEVCEGCIYGNAQVAFSKNSLESKGSVGTSSL